MTGTQTLLRPPAGRSTVLLAFLAAAACSESDEVALPDAAGSTSVAPGAGATGGGGRASPDPLEGRGGAPLPPPETPAPAAPTWGPPGRPALPLAPVGDGLSAYVPHRPLAHRVKGSGHTHCAPDHSGISAAAQQQRLRDLPGAHRHGFVWMTGHTFVAPDPGVSGIVHLFAAEVYSSKYPSSGAEPHVLAYLPKGDLALGSAPGVSERPFGYFKHDLNTLSELVGAQGGLLAWAHPSRNPLTEPELAAVKGLWGMEVVSGATDVQANLAFLDRRLSAGHYTCLTGGGDIHAETTRLTRGYQLVEVEAAEPSREQIFASVAACNFFVCAVQDTSVEPLEPPYVSVEDEKISVRLPRAADAIRFVGAEGEVLHTATGVDAATYPPTAADGYVRVEMSASAGKATCYSQPIWLVGAADPVASP